MDKIEIDAGTGESFNCICVIFRTKGKRKRTSDKKKKNCLRPTRKKRNKSLRSPNFIHGHLIIILTTDVTVNKLQEININIKQSIRSTSIVVQWWQVPIVGYKLNYIHLVSPQIF